MGSCFFSARGTVFAYSMGSKSSKGFYALKPPISQTDTGNSPVLIDGVELSDVDLVAPMPLLSGFKVLYTFGTDFGNVVIHGKVLLGPTADTAASMGNVIAYFNAYRISNSPPQYIQVSVPGAKAYNVFLTGLAMGLPDPMFHTQPFALTGLIADP